VGRRIVIVVDTSAIVAMLLEEPDNEYLKKIVISEDCIISAPTVTECHCVMMRRRSNSHPLVISRFIKSLLIDIIPFEESHTEISGQAYFKYGKGSGHPAQLNLGDTFSYALAKTRNIPLLFKGNDFIHTDIIPALPQAA
jgi:ribonuclease VapC